MVVCPKCGNEFEDGTVFCPNCGARTEEQIAERTEERTERIKVCPQCGAQTNAALAFCENCGAEIVETSVSVIPQTEAPKKKFPKKALLIGGISVVLVIAILVGVLSIAGHKSSPASYALYLKDSEIFLNDFSGKEPLQMTRRLIDSGRNDNESLSELSLYTQCVLAKDGQLLFFPDKIDTRDDSYSIYYKSIGESDEDAKKLDSEIDFYNVNDDATIATYEKDDNSLYQYDMRKEERNKVANDVSDWQVSDDGKTVLYIDRDGNLYRKHFGKDKEKIDSDVGSLKYFSDDMKTVFYTKDDSLYRSVQGKDKKKISSNVDNVLTIYDSGEAYYCKENIVTIRLMDHIQDDMKKQDAALTMPEAPSYYDYDDEDSYYRARDAYVEARDLYYEKETRDELRVSLSNETVEKTLRVLYYFDGTEEKKIADSFMYYDHAVDSPVIAFKCYGEASTEKVRLSEIESYYDAENAVLNALYSTKVSQVAVKGVVTPVECENAADFYIDDAGKNACFIDNVPEEKNYGDLYKISISGSKPEKPVLYDSDVSLYCGVAFIEDGAIMYFKDRKGYTADLYIDKKLIDYEVYIGGTHLTDANEIVYFTDYDDDSDSGTLKIYRDGKKTKIGDDAYNCLVLPDGSVLYLSDYSSRHSTGELYLFKKDEAKKIDDDVVRILRYRVS